MGSDQLAPAVGDLGILAATNGCRRDPYAETVGGGKVGSANAPTGTAITSGASEVV
jgi:hypothetical protein